MNTDKILMLIKFGLSLALMGLMGSTFAIDLKTSVNKNNTSQSSTFEPPNDGAPGRREDAGSRPGCPQTDKPFMALIPGTNLGVTGSDHPTFWLYIPYASGVVELTLNDEQTKGRIYKTRFQVNSGLGIIGYRLPSHTPPLEIGKKYRWKFDLFCRSGSESEFLSVNGVIVRQALPQNLKIELEKATPQQQINLYATYGFWYDTLTELAILYHANSQNNQLKEQWTTLLKHPLVKLDKITSEPIIIQSAD